jgi:hypothetical protein
MAAMTRVMRNVLLFLLGAAAAAAAQPTITVLSSTTAERSSRVLIQGSGFGAVQNNGHVDIGGISAPLTRWSNTLISAYVPESTAVSTVNVQVVDSQGVSSNVVPLSVTLRPAQSGHNRWRFQADADYIQSRPAVASDGTVYAIDVYGHLYALTSNGGLKWIVNVPGTGFGNVSVAADGTIYAGSTTTIVALTPVGTLKWQFKQNPAAFILLGPNVGPDGNIYAVGTQGLGVFSLTPLGSLRWSVPENYDRPIVVLQEIVFGPAQQARLYFHANNHLRSIGLDGSPLFTYPSGVPGTDQQPAVAPDGSLYTNLFSATGQGLTLGKFDNNGNLLWTVFDQFVTSTNVLGTPEVGPDGVTYDGRNLMSLYAINPDSTVRWQYTDAGILLSQMVSPLNDIIFVGGIVDYGQPGFFEALSTTGTALWKTVLPLANGLNIVPMSRARFTPDGQTAYIGTSIPGQASDGYSYLYSVQTGTASAPSLASLVMNPNAVVGGSPSLGTVTLTAAAPAGDMSVSLTSNNVAVTVPRSVTVPAGTSAVTFSATTSPVTASLATAISASAGGKTVGSILSVTPAAPTIYLTLNPTIVGGGGTSRGVVKLAGSAPTGGATITLTSSNPAVASVPSSLIIAAGGTQGSFTAKTAQVGVNTQVVIAATYAGGGASATLTVVPLAVSSLVLNPTKVIGGNPSTATITLNKPAPTGGAFVNLTSGNTAVATVPATVTVAAGTSSATFTVSTKHVTAKKTPAISATLGGVTKRATLTVTP